MKKQRRPGERSAQEKLRAVIEYEGMPEDKRGEYLRREGLQSEHIEGWKKSMEAGLGGSALSAAERSERAADKKKIQELERELRRKDKALAETTALLVLKKKADLIWGGGGGRVSVADRQSCIELVEKAKASGARRQASCEVLEVSLRTLERWEKDPDKADGRRGPKTACGHRLSDQEKQAMVEVCNSPEYRDLSPWQIVARLADAGEYLGSESSFYRVLKQNELLTHRHNSKPPGGQSAQGFGGPKAQRGLELGHHVSEQCDPGRVLLSVSGGRYLQPQDRGLEDRRSRERGVRRSADRRHLCGASPCERTTDDSLGQRRADEGSDFAGDPGAIGGGLLV